jgi:hypothetical protein
MFNISLLSQYWCTKWIFDLVNQYNKYLAIKICVCLHFFIIELWKYMIDVILKNYLSDALLSSLLNPLEGQSVLNYGNMELGGAPDFQH